MNRTCNKLTIVHEDPLFVVVDKPGGLLSVPGRGADKQDCVANRIKDYLEGCIDQPTVHRLDMDTSGLMVLALTVEAHSNLSRQFRERLVEKNYIALLDGIMTGKTGEIDLAFRLDPDNRPYQVYDPVHGKRGISRWKNLGVEGEKTRVEFIPVTGRTHQLRIHAAHEYGLNIPISGDRLYGNGRGGEPLMLHACYLSFFHPATGEKMEFRSEAPF